MSLRTKAAKAAFFIGGYMSKILFAADVHIHPHKKSSERLQDCLNALDWIFQTAQEQGIKHIVILGDLFHDRQKIDVPTYQKTFEIFMKHMCDENLYVYLLLGNHDLWHLQKWDISSVFPLAALNNVIVINQPSTIQVAGTSISFLPYTADPLIGLQKLAGESRILCGHLAVDGAVLNVMHGVRSEVSVEHDGGMAKLDSSIFGSWDYVFLGHYHAAQKLDFNVEYVGSPLQLSFGEAFQHKHVMVFDTESHEQKYVRNTFSPQHFIIPVSDLEKYELKNNFVKIIIGEDISASQIIELKNEVEKQSVGSFDIVQDAKHQEQKQIIEDAKAILLDQENMVEEFIKECRRSGKIESLTDDMLYGIWKRITEQDKNERE